MEETFTKNKVTLPNNKRKNPLQRYVTDKLVRF